MRKRIVISALLIVLALPTLVLFYLLYSEAGVKLLLPQLGRLQSISIKVDGVEGRLAGPLRIRRFELDHKRVHLLIDDLRVDFKPFSLFAGVLGVDELTAGRVAVSVKRSTGPKQDTPPRFLPGRLRIRVERADIRAASFVYVESAPIVADRLAGRVALSPQRLQVDGLVLESAAYDAQGALELRAAQTIELGFSGEARYSVPTDVALRGHVEVQGAFNALDMRAQLREPSPATAEARLEFPNGAWQIRGTARSPAFALTPWLQNSPFSLQQVAMNFTLNSRQINLNGDLNVPELSTLPLHLAAYGNYRERVLRIANAEITAKNGALALTASGDLRFDSAQRERFDVTQPGRVGESQGMALDARARWRGLTWPLEANRNAALVSSASGELTLSGTLPYRFTTQADVVTQVGGTAVDAHVAAAGLLSKEALRVSEYEIAALAGTAKGGAELQFAQPRAWSIEMAAQDINPESLNANFPGRVVLQARAQGRGFNKQANFTAQIAQLSGVLRNKSLSGRGGIEYSAQNWRVQQLQLGLGATRLNLDGAYGRQLSLSGELHTTALQDLDIGGWGLNGQMDLRAQATGPLAAPHVRAQLDAPELRFGAWQANRLNVDADIDVADREDSKLSAKAARVTYNNYAMEAPQVEGAGKASAHRIALSTGLGTLKNNLIAIDADLQGRYADDNWSGMLTRAVVMDADKKERAHLTQSMNARVSKGEAELNQLCFEFDRSHGCARGSWQRQGAWQIVAAVDDLPLSLLNSPQAQSLRYDGTLHADIDMKGGLKQAWEGKAGLRLVDGAVSYPSVNGRYETLPITEAQANVRTEGLKLLGTVNLRAGDDTRVNAQIELAEKLDVEFTQWPLQGALQAHSADAKILPLLVAQLDRATGMLDANLQVGGSLAQPRLQGTVQLRDGEADLYQVNLALRQLNFLATLNDNRLRLEGKAKAGDGELNVSGDLAWNKMQPSGDIQIKGQNLLVADLPEYRVVASPDLNFNISGSNIAAVGDILIPSARLQPENISGAVQQSSDARLVSEKNIGRQSGLTVVSEIRIRLGDDVQVDALGLQGKLGGNVGTTLRTGETPVGRGELTIQDGRYEAYGQKLNITRGRLIFDASPLDDPGLDIQAERRLEAENITVGVNVRGVLRAPRLQFYSTPTMSQQQIVAYMLFGKPVDELQGSETTTVKSTTNTLAMKGGGLLASQLGQRIGLEEVGVETDANNQSSLVLGKFLSPRLFVSYGISLTEAINTLKLRYTISDKWVLKTEAGAAQSADVEFKIER